MDAEGSANAPEGPPKTLTPEEKAEKKADIELMRRIRMQLDAQDLEIYNDVFNPLNLPNRNEGIQRFAEYMELDIHQEHVAPIIQRFLPNYLSNCSEKVLEERTDRLNAALFYYLDALNEVASDEKKGRYGPSELLMDAHKEIRAIFEEAYPEHEPTNQSLLFTKELDKAISQIKQRYNDAGQSGGMSY